MARKATIKRESVFSNLGGREEPSAADEKQYRATTVWLCEDEMQWLDDLCHETRRGPWKGITRSALLRVLIRAARRSGVSLSGSGDELEAEQWLFQQLQRKHS
jgi:hypothetical protein